MKKKIIILIVLLSLLCGFFIQESLAKYLTSANEMANMSIARWKILVNNEDIKNENNVNTIIAPVFPGNENIAENIIAPTSEGYFDLVIDGREADVSFKYKITISVNEESTVKDLIATKYKIDNGQETPLPIEETTPPAPTSGTDVTPTKTQTIEGTILHQNNANPITIRVFIKWDDSETATMNNQQDTEATKSNIPAKMNVNLSFTQVV